jgi:N-acetylmuramoyl-L-alanine amidase
VVSATVLPAGRGGSLITLRITAGAVGERLVTLDAAGRLPERATIGATPLSPPPPAPRPDSMPRPDATLAAGDDRPALPRLQQPAVPPVVAIDAGHGGVDPGAISRSGLYEKHVTLAVAREVRDALQALGPYRAVLIRSRDRYIRLRDRVTMARRAGADLMLSIHADTMENPAVRGLSVYTLSERASDAEAAALADRENKADLIANLDLRGSTPEVTNILIDLAQRDTMNASARFAALAVNTMADDIRLLPRPHRFAGFAVLKAPDVPSVLIELGFLSNPGDERMLAAKPGRRKLGRAIARAVDAYFTSVEVARGR